MLSGFGTELRASLFLALFPIRKAEFDRAQLDDALKLRKRARDFALLLEDPKVMLIVADHLAPELGVYPRAKSEHASPQTAIQINVGMAELGERLQKSLRKMNP